MSLPQILIDWKNSSFRDHEISVGLAADSLRKKENAVQARPWTNGRWVMFNKATGKGAVFTYTGVIRWTSDIYTGNYVPDGHEAPPGVPESRIQNKPSMKCEFSYAFDTSIDVSLWDDLKVFEEHVIGQKDFNRAGRKRRPWQTGNLASDRDKYVVSSRVFARQTVAQQKKPGGFSVPYTLHPWIKIALEEIDETHQIPNPDRPRYYVYDSDTQVLSRLEDDERPQFDRNDVVHMSFMLVFSIAREYWTPEIVPMELTRVGTIAPTSTLEPNSESLPGIDSFEPLAIGSVVRVINPTGHVTPAPPRAVLADLTLNGQDPMATQIEPTCAELSPLARRTNLKRKADEISDENSYSPTSHQVHQMDVEMEPAMEVEENVAGPSNRAIRSRTRRERAC